MQRSKRIKKTARPRAARRVVRRRMKAPLNLSLRLAAVRKMRHARRRRRRRKDAKLKR